jgi:hypothetical protein
MAAAGAPIQMTSHGSGAASLNCDEHFQVHPREPRGGTVCETVDSGGYDVGQLQERPIHLLAVFRFRSCGETERIQGAGGSLEVALRQMKITAGGLQIVGRDQSVIRVQDGAAQPRRSQHPSWYPTRRPVALQSRL